MRGCAGLDDVLQEAGEVAGPGAARIHERRDTARPCQFAGVDPQGRAPPIDMGVEVDEAR